ncbi:MAG: 2-oxoisovalerate dehydrogenase E1 subunit beta [Porticoccaceae bacterium]
MTTEIVFVVEQAPEGGYTAHAAGHAIFTEADDLESMPAQVRDAVHCHFDEHERPKLIRLHYVRDQVIAA